MTVTPTVPLLYATGLHANLASLAAKAYTITLNTSANDAAGNGLAAPYAFTFKTLRQISHTVNVSSIIRVYSDGGIYNEFETSDCNARVGDNLNKHYDRMFIEFPLTAVPTDVKTFVAATLRMTIFTVGGTPFSTLGSLNVTHTNEATFTLDSILAPGLPPAAGALGVIVSSATPVARSLSVTAAVADDYANLAQREGRSQFRLGFPVGTDNDTVNDYVDFYCVDTNPMQLEMSYLLP